MSSHSFTHSGNNLCDGPDTITAPLCTHEGSTLYVSLLSLELWTDRVWILIPLISNSGTSILLASFFVALCRVLRDPSYCVPIFFSIFTDFDGFPYFLLLNFMDRIMDTLLLADSSLLSTCLWIGAPLPHNDDAVFYAHQSVLSWGCLLFVDDISRPSFCLRSASRCSSFVRTQLFFISHILIFGELTVLRLVVINRIVFTI